MTVDDTSRQDCRKLALRPADDLHGGAVRQHLRKRRGPQHPIDEVVGPVGTVSDSVAVEIKRRVIAPVVAVAIHGPIEVTRANVLNLVTVVDEGVPGDFIPFQPAVKWTPISQLSNQLSRNLFLLAL